MNEALQSSHLPTKPHISMLICVLVICKTLSLFCILTLPTFHSFLSINCSSFLLFCCRIFSFPTSFSFFIIHSSLMKRLVFFVFHHMYSFYMYLFASKTKNYKIFNEGKYDVYNTDIGEICSRYVLI